MTTPLLPKPDIVVFHSQNSVMHCDDGFGAAWAINRKWPEGIEYIPGVYGQPAPLADLAGKHVLMVDFTYKLEVLEAIGREMESRYVQGKPVGSLTILDHHSGAIEA